MTVASKRLRELKRQYYYGHRAPSERDILWAEMRGVRLAKELNRLRDALAEIAEGKCADPRTAARNAIRQVDFS
jgi:hypothetical protein